MMTDIENNRGFRGLDPGLPPPPIRRIALLIAAIPDRWLMAAQVSHP
jgi:hypothetical protein